MVDFWVKMVKNGYDIEKVPIKYREAVRKALENE